MYLFQKLKAVMSYMQLLHSSPSQESLNEIHTLTSGSEVVPHGSEMCG